MSKLIASALLIFALATVDAHGAASDNPEATKEPSDSKVRVIEYEGFYRFIDRNPLVLMEFYAPWCGHCQELAPKYREAAAILSNADLQRPVVLAKYDDSTDSQRRLRAGAEDVFNFNAYPALFVFEDGKHKKYTGGRETKDIVAYMTAVSKGLNPEDEEAKLRPGLYKEMPDYDPKIFMELEPETFESTVLTDQNAVWIVEFYSDHCPFCKSLAPELMKAARASVATHGTKVRFGGLNTRIFHELGKKLEITGFPWVSCFYQGKKTEDMAGLGGAESVINWANKKIGDHNPVGGSVAAAPAPSSAGNIYFPERATLSFNASSCNFPWDDVREVTPGLGRGAIGGGWC